MTLGFRGKLFAVSFFVIATVATAGLLLTASLRNDLVSRLERELTRHAEVARSMLSRETDRAGLEAVVTLLAHSSGLEIEISDRLSATSPDDMQFVELAFESPAGSGFVRVGSYLTEVDEAVSGIRLLILIITGLALIVAVLMSGLASSSMQKTLRRLAASANAEASEEPLVPKGEGDKLDHSVSEMAIEVQSTVAELAKERALVKAVLKGMSEAVIALDHDRRVTLMNPAAVELLGLSDVPRGRSILEILRVPSLQKLVGDRPVEGPDSTEFELPNERHVLARIRPQRGQRGSVLVMHDVTDIRRLETVRRDFVANVSHELRTPVAIIRANSETLLDGALEDPEMSKTLVDALHRNAERLSNIIDDLLDLSKIEAGRYLLELEPVSISAIADSAVKSIERAAAAKAIEITVEVDGEPVCLADAQAIEQVLFNLLDNAVKYTPDEGHIRISTELEGNICHILVEDNGPGIAPRHRERVFERFYRVDPGRSRIMGGTGLGLAIVRHLVENMRGKVSVRGAKPHGAIFVISMPIAKEGHTFEQPSASSG